MQAKSQKYTPEERARFWSAHINKWRQGSLTKAEYCRRAELSKHAFYYWCKKLGHTNSRKTQEENAIVPVPLKVVQEKTHTPLRLMVNSYQVDIPGDFQQEVLAKLVRTLEEIT